MNTSENQTDRCYPGLVSMPVVYWAAGLIIACLNVCCCVALALSKTISESVRRPFMLLCFCDVFYGTALILFSYPDKDTSTELCYTIRFLFTLYGTLSATVIFLLSVDRYAILYFETFYMNDVTPIRVRVVYIMVWIIAPILTFIRMGLPEIGTETFHTITRTFREVVFASCGMSFRILTLLFAAGTLLKIRIIQNRMPFVRGEFQRTTKILCIICIYQLMSIPSTIYRLMWVTRPDLMDWLGPFRQLSTVVLTFTCFINPIFYMTNFRECRLSMLQIICWWNKQMSGRIKYKKKQLMASFLDTNVSRPQQNPRVADFPNSGMKRPTVERNPHNRRISVTDIQFTVPHLHQQPSTLVTDQH